MEFPALENLHMYVTVQENNYYDIVYVPQDIVSYPFGVEKSHKYVVILLVVIFPKCNNCDSCINFQYPQ